MSVMKTGYNRYLLAKKRLELEGDTPEIIEEIQLAYAEVFEEHKKWFFSKDAGSNIKKKGRPLPMEMIRDLSIYFGNSIAGFPSKFKKDFYEQNFYIKNSKLN